MGNKVSFVFVAQDRFSRIAQKAQRISDGLKRKMDQLGAAAKRTGTRFTELRTKMRGTVDTLKGLGGRLTLFATAPILALGTAMVRSASDAEEVRSKFDTVFRDISTGANKTADDLAKGFGLSGTKARELIGDTGDLLTGFGFTQDMALDLSKQVNELAVDLASFTNFSGGAEGASAALTKALLGERDSVKSLGISILEEDVKRQIAINSSKGMRFATERQAKAFATLTLAQNQSKNAIGDFARTQDSLANKQRILSARVQDLSEKYGKILMPVAIRIVNVLTNLADKFTNLSPSMQKTILIVLGVVAVAGPLLLLFAGFVAIIPAMVTGFGILAGVVAALASPFILIPLAIAAVVAGIVLMYRKFEWFKTLVDVIVESVMSLVTALFNIATFPVKMIAKLLDFGGGIDVSQASRTDVNVNLSAPAGAIESVKSTTTGQVSGMNVGMNMATAQ